MFGFIETMKRFPTFVTCCSVLLASNLFSSLLLGQEFETAKHQNWHQWRGPTAAGVASLGNPPVEWSNETNIKWKFQIAGEGSSTPIVWQNQVFVLSAIETDRKRDAEPKIDREAKTVPPPHILQFVVWCLDRATGHLLWKKIVTETAPHEGRHHSTTYAAASPTTDGQRIYASFGSYGIFCLTMKGDLVWEKDIGDMRTRRGWGEAVSPVIHDGKLIVNWDQEDQSKIFVFAANNGDLIWQKDRDEPTTWATPLVTIANEKTQLITNGTNSIRSYDLDNGEIIWETRGTTLNAIPSPVRSGNNVICMAGYRGNLAIAISLNSKGRINHEKVGPDQPVKWKLVRQMPYVPSPVLVGNRLYFTKSNVAILSCHDAATGEMLYRNAQGNEQSIRLAGLKNMYASPVAVADRIYLTSREGVTLVIRNSPKLEVLATNRLGEAVDASPAIAGNQMFIRGKRHLYCIEQTDPAAELSSQ